MLNVLKTRLAKRTTYFTTVLMLTLFAAAPSAFAAPEIVNGAKNLFSDALTWVLILVPVSAALMVGYHALMKSWADGDPGAIAERNKKMKNVFTAAIIAESASSLVKAILAYFS